ncbi:MAG: NFACT family protein [Armatimonadota bacterium]|nr:NFACT family protein [Armatimonadota bacterium]MDR5696860.1 NFACT family protein [Armatimonadota bacterium]
MPDLPAPSFDAVTLAAVAAELGPLLPARIRRVAQPDPHEVVLELRGVGILLLSADPRWARAHLLEAWPDGDGSGPFGQLLRARLNDALVTGLVHPAFERVLELHVDALDGPYRLVAEPMGKHANLILVRDGLVVGAAKVIGPHRSRLRPVVPGSPYAPPPPDTRPRPGKVLDLGHVLAQGTGPAWRRLLAAVAGIGPLLAYELCTRAGHIDASVFDAAAASRLAAELDDLARRVHQADFDPRLYRQGEQATYSPFPFVCLRGWHEVATTMSRAIEQTLGARIVDDRRQQRCRALRGQIESALRRRRNALAQAERSLTEATDADRLRMFGELLLAYAAQVPRGVDVVALADYEGRPTEIPLDPARSAIENAQHYFRRYRKVRAGAESLPVRIAALRDEITYLEAARFYVENAHTDEDLVEIEQELADAGYLRHPRERRRVPTVSQPRTYQVDGFTVWVGRSGRDNDRVTFRLAAPSDLWFHARGQPGAHVILQVAGRRPEERTIERVAALAAYHSAGRDAGAVDVDVTERRNVWKPKGAPPGVAHYRGERTLRVRPWSGSAPPV